MPARQHLRQLVESRAAGRCEYCCMHQSLQGATFHIEHIVPQSKGGGDESDNLAWACPSCNLHKSDRTHVIDGGMPVELFHPRQHDWNDHYRWDEYAIVGRTPTGSATVVALELNQVRRMQIRQAEQRLGLFPPEQAVAEK